MSKLEKVKNKIFQRFLNTFQVLIWVDKCSGVTAVTYSNGQFHSSIPNIYGNIFASLIYLLLILYCIYGNINDDKLDTIHKTTNILLVITWGCYVAGIWLASAIKSGRFAGFLVAIVAFDIKLYEASGISLNYARKKRKLLIQLCLRGVFGSIYVFFYAFFFNSEQEFYDQLQHCIAFLMLFVNSVFCHHSAELVNLIHERYVILNEEIKKIVKLSYQLPDKKPERILSLSRICSLHHHLTKLIKDFNNIYGIVLLMMFALSFICTVLSVFYTTGELQARQINWEAVFYDASTCITFIIDCVYVCDVCYSTIEEVLTKQIAFGNHQLKFITKNTKQSFQF